MDFGAARKRSRVDYALNGNGGPKKYRQQQESESFPTGVGSKSKPCTKFFSTSGCPFGESCHFLHHVPGGYKAVSQMMNLSVGPQGPAPPARNAAPPPPSYPEAPQSGVKGRMCNKYNTAEGCRFGNKCHFAHGEWELGKPTLPSHDEPRLAGPISGRMGGGNGSIEPPPSGLGARMVGGSGRMEPPPPGLGAAASFGLSSTAKISVDASLAGAIIGKGGVNSKQICRVTGAKLSIRDHESDPNLRNIELEGTFDQIKQATTMVREVIVNVSANAVHGVGKGGHGHGHGHGAPLHAGSGTGGGSNYKTKLCENFTKGSCTFGDRCHFAHGDEELRKSAI